MFLLHTSKARSGKRWWGQLSTWGTVSYSSTYAFIAVSGTASERCGPAGKAAGAKNVKKSIALPSQIDL